jgi:simple sugar transport system substrate-binding protein
MVWLRRFSALFLVPLVMVVAACGSSDSSGGTGTGSSTASSGDATTAAAAPDRPKIGFVVPVLENPYWKLEADYAKAAGKSLGADVLIGDAKSQDSTLVSTVENWISSGVDGIVVGLVTDSTTSKILADAKAAGVPVTFMQRGPSVRPEEADNDSYIGFVGTNDVDGGKITAKALYDAGSRKVVAMTTEKGNQTGIDRLQGLLDFAKDHPDMKVLQSFYGVELRSDAATAMENLLSAFPGPGFDGVWCVNDECALGAIQALNNAGVLDKVKLTGMDGTPEGIDAVKSGKVISAPGGGFVDGGFALTMLYDAIKGHKPAQPWVLLPYVDVTPDNATAFQQTYIDGASSFDFKKFSATYTPGASSADYALPPLK